MIYFMKYHRHGSRLTNFAGIMSQGLRIAPPEAPVVRKYVVFFLIEFQFLVLDWLYVW